MFGINLILGSIVAPIIGVIIFATLIFVCKGFFTNEVNEAHVLTFFGKYYGTVKKNGFLWINPLTSKRCVSLKAQNLNGAVIKVNDKHGNPVMMGCVVVWKIFDTAKATFEVDSCETYIRIQSEGVVREVGCLFPYDKLSEEDTITLKGDQKEINRILVQLLTKRCMPAGIEIIEAKITELSYANEIAEVMLKTQAADAVIAARDKIVNGAVSMIGHALRSLDTNEICKMSREKKAKLVSNMLVILCGESQNNSNVGSSAPRLMEGMNKYH
jgi:regulator of protease activity HflC (stomatin/prohibitin superfamily)